MPRSRFTSRFWRKVSALGIVLALILLCVFGLLTVYILDSRQQSRSVQMAREQTELIDRVTADFEVRDLNHLLSLFRRALGGDTAVDRVRTVQFTGALRSKESPHLNLRSHKRATTDHYQLTLYNQRVPNSFSWRPGSLIRRGADGEDRPVEDPVLVERFGLDAYIFFAPLRQSNTLPLRFVGLEEKNGQVYNVAESTGGLVAVRFFFETDTGLLRYREIPPYADRAAELDEFHDYREVGGVLFPHRILYWQDNAYLGDLYIHEINLNVGFFPDLPDPS
jgi:hypothetical protein